MRRIHHHRGILALGALLVGCGADIGNTGTDAAALPPGGDPPIDGGTGGSSPVDGASGPVVDAAGSTDGCSAGTVQLLANPAFDEGATGWIEVAGPINFPEDQLPIAVHTGTRAAWMGRAGPVDQRLSQTVTVPEGATSLTLRGMHCFVTERSLPDQDTVTIAVLDPDGDVLETPEVFANDDAGATCGWEPFQLAIGDHPGEEIQLELRAVSDSAGLTSFYFDSLSLEATVDCP
jgi:hypothetical protein